MPEVLDRDTIKAISTDTRQDIMKMLAKRNYTASEIAKITKKHVTTITEHLNILEKSGLIRKKESTNKWIYYELTERGEHLFKPNFYSFVIVFSLSAVLMFTGFLRFFRFEFFGASSTARSGMMESGSALATVQKTSDTVSQSVTTFDVLGVALIILGIIGFGYLVYRHYRINK